MESHKDAIAKLGKPGTMVRTAKSHITRTAVGKLNRNQRLRLQQVIGQERHLYNASLLALEYADLNGADRSLDDLAKELTKVRQDQPESKSTAGSLWSSEPSSPGMPTSTRTRTCRPAASPAAKLRNASVLSRIPAASNYPFSKT